MALVVPNEGEVLLMERMLGTFGASLLVDTHDVRLYTAFITLDESTTFASFTEPVDGSYTPQVLSGAWTIAEVSAITTASASVTFTFATGTETYHGYWIAGSSNNDATNDTVLWAKQFDIPVIAPGTGTVDVDVDFTAS